MKRTFLKSCITLALASVTSLAITQALATTAINVNTIDNVEQSKANYLAKDGKYLYFIHLNDKPLATYDGSLLDYSATSVMATKGKNSTHNKQLDVHSSVSKNYRSHLQMRQASLKTDIQKVLKRDVSFLNQYQVILNATTAYLTPEEATRLQSLNSVAMVTPVERHELHTDVGPTFIKAPYVWEKDWGSLNGTPGKSGFMGEGVIVGIMDTGIDYTNKSFAATGDDGYTHNNPILGGGYLGDCAEGKDPSMCNDKLIGIVSFPYIIDTYSVVEQVEVPPYGIDFHNHGTHVASTAAGNIINNIPIYNIFGEPTDTKFSQLSGVAPHANIISYQVCAPSGDLYPTQFQGCYPHLAVEAMEHAIENGVTVMNYSVGGSARDAWDEENTDSQMFLNAREAGLHIATSAGNSGRNGAETIGSPANSPWITTVAAFTHDRKVDKEVNNFTGGSEELRPDTIAGVATSGGVTATVINAADYGDGLCNEEFAADTFNGEIVVCRRGVAARIDKGKNVLAGGAGGLILVNAETDSGIVGDAHYLPAIHIEYNAGIALYDWLAEGEGHSATITPFVSGVSNAELADIAGAFTSQGPNPMVKSFISPDLAGPGVDIYAGYTTFHPFISVGAGEEAPSYPPFGMMSGTSMSSPHVAGALALIHGVHPTWDPSETQSAMMLTAVIDNLKTTTDEASTPFIHGSGSLRIDKAVETGLVMYISKEEYLAADPRDRYDEDLNLISEAGDPSTLNLPSFTQEGCLISCSWTRTFKAVKDATWTASYDARAAGLNLSVSPASFTLKTGESQTVTITATASGSLTEEWAEGYIRFNSDNANIPEVHLTGMVNFIGGTIENEDAIEINNNNGSVTFDEIISIGSDNLQAQAFGPSLVQSYTAELTRESEILEGTQPPEWFLEDEALHIIQVTTSLETRRLVIRITESEAPDLDLFVGLDANKDGKPGVLEYVMCISGKMGWDEECVIESETPQIYWIAVHQFASSAPGAVDKHTIEIINLEERGDVTSVTVPDSVASNEKFAVKVDFTDPQMQADNKYMVGLELGTNTELRNNIGFAFAEIIRGGDEVSASEPVISEGSLTMNVNALGNNSEQYKLYQFELTLQDGMIMTEITLTGDASTVGYQVNGNLVTWSYMMAPASAAVDFSISVDTSAVTTDIVTPELSSNSFLTALTAPTLSTETQSLSVNSGDAVSIDFTSTTGSELAQIETQLMVNVISGTAEVTVSGDNISFSAPTLAAGAADSEVVLEVTATNGHLASQPVTVTVAVKAPAAVVIPPPPEDSSGGGSLGFIFIGLLGLVGATRRRV